VTRSFGVARSLAETLRSNDINDLFLMTGGDQALWIEVELPFEPRLTPLHDVGPILLGARKPALIATPSATVRRLVNLTALAVVDAASR